MNATRLSIFGISFAVLLGLVLAGPQDKSKPAQQQAEPQQTDTNARPLTEKEKKLRDRKRRQELASPYKKWLNEDVSFIITDEERSAFNKLQTDEEREQFIEQFWLRRDPSPDTEENEFKEEHYRRIAYANERFASGIPGWKTDRGRIYITFGPPDEIEDHSSGGFYERPPEEGGGETSTFPFQQWRYRYIEGIGNNIIIEFVDTTMSGEFRMTSDPSEKDALLYVPNAGLTMMEQMGMSDKTARFNNSDGTHLGVPFGGQPESMNEFNRLEQFAKLQRAPAIKLTDLEADVKSRITYNILPMKVLVDYFPVTDASVLTTITVQFDNKDLQWQSKDGGQQAKMEILGKITTMTRRMVAHPFDEPVTSVFPAANVRGHSQREVDLPESGSAGSRHLSPGSGCEGCGRRQLRRVPAGDQCAAARSGQADLKLAGAGGYHGAGSDEKHRHRHVRDRRHKGAAAPGQFVQAGRNPRALFQGL